MNQPPSGWYSRKSWTHSCFGTTRRISQNVVDHRGSGQRIALATTVFALFEIQRVNRPEPVFSSFPPSRVHYFDGIGSGPVLSQFVLERFENAVTVACLFHVDQVENDDAADVSKLELKNDFFDRFKIDLHSGFFEKNYPPSCQSSRRWR